MSLACESEGRVEQLGFMLAAIFFLTTTLSSSTFVDTDQQVEHSKYCVLLCGGATPIATKSYIAQGVFGVWSRSPRSQVLPSHQTNKNLRNL